jgi:hypothetical protein
LQVGGDSAGNVTSVTMDGHAALGYVRAAFAHEGQQISVGDLCAKVSGLAQV